MLHSNSKEDKSEFEIRHASLTNRVDSLEVALGTSANKHVRALEEVKTSHSKLLGDLKARELSDITINDKMQRFERRLEESQLEVQKKFEKWQNCLEQDLQSTQRRLAAELRADVQNVVSKHETATRSRSS